jgi:D-beta-D-heptose 7-phosphate kinase / D-beta-D-heptose 1-phosphate adenosyltransferase
VTSLVVVGDTLLDRDVDGTADRVCPDAPALVLAETGTTDRPGGAGLAAVLAVGHGYDVTLVTALSGDKGGDRLWELLTAAGVTVHALPLPGPTPEKTRLRAGGQVLLRLDRGGGARPGGPPTRGMLSAVRTAAAVLVSDYGGGVTQVPELRATLADTPAALVWDPHPGGAPAVAGSHLITPNEPELAVLTGAANSRAPAGARRLASLTRAAHQLRRRWGGAAVAVTLGPDGALLCHNGPAPLMVPAPTRARGDSCGAGDRFASAATLALADGALVSEAVESAVAQAAAYVAAGGAAGGAAGASRATDPEPGPVAAGRHSPPAWEPPAPATADAQDLVARVRSRAGTVVATGGCFDLLHAGHLATLQAARGLGDCLVVCVNSDASVAGLKGPDRPVVPLADRIRLLSALGCVDAVVAFDEPTPEAVLGWLRPDIWVKGGDYAGGTADATDLPESGIVRRHGGHTVIVPYLDGRSTSRMLASRSKKG